MKETDPIGVMASDIEIGENVQPEGSSADDLILSFRGLSGLFLKLNLTKLWNSFSFKKCFNKMAFVGFFLSLFNIGSDYFLSYSFIFGANYTKTVDDVKNYYVTNFTCTHIETNLKYDNLTASTKVSVFQVKIDQI